MRCDLVLALLPILLLLGCEKKLYNPCTQSKIPELWSKSDDMLEMARWTEALEAQQIGGFKPHPVQCLTRKQISELRGISVTAVQRSMPGAGVPDADRAAYNAMKRQGVSEDAARSMASTIREACEKADGANCR